MQRKIHTISIVLFFNLICFGGETAQDIISEYKKNSEKSLVQITKSETFTTYYKSQQDKKPTTELRVTEFRRDQQRWEILETTFFEPEQPDGQGAEFQQSMRQIWDGKFLYGHWFYEDTPENVLQDSPIVISHKPNYEDCKFGIGYYGAPFEGVFTGDLETIPTILGRCNSITVRDRKETIGNYECYVIDAIGNDGKYTIWITPEYGYNIIQAEVEKTKGDLMYGKQFTNKDDNSIDKLKFNIRNVKLENIQGIWIPMEGDFFIETTRGDDVSKTHRHHKRDNIDLNPDFEKIGAFVPNIPNGTYILIMETPSMRYIWQNGKPVTYVDEKFLDVLDNEIEQVKTATPKAVTSQIPHPKSQTACNIAEPNKEHVNIIKTPDDTESELPKKNHTAVFIIASIAIAAVIALIVFFKFRRKKNNA